MLHLRPDRLEDSEIIAVEWRHSSDGPARKYLTLTAAGLSALKQLRNDWTLFTRLMGRYLDCPRNQLAS
ncbi:MAG: PadR family transcriptional regulator [Canibacter sp.]